jgi:hypothetical protein
MAKSPAIDLVLTPAREFDVLATKLLVRGIARAFKLGWGLV